MAVSPIRNPAGLRAALNRTLWHRYDRTPQTSTTVDGEEVSVPGTTVVGVACRYEAQGRVIRDARGQTTISGPVLIVASDDPLAAGDQVANIRNAADGEVQLIGPLSVQRRLDSADVGVTLVKEFELFGADPGRSA